jgi:NAD-dependent SIR2 family protein deacetylase
MAPPFQLCESNTSFSEAFESVSQILQSCSQILVLAGAGISVSCGIPDFRSPQGLYATLDSKVR